MNIQHGGNNYLTSFAFFLVVLGSRRYQQLEARCSVLAVDVFSQPTTTPEENTPTWSVLKVSTAKHQQTTGTWIFPSILVVDTSSHIIKSLNDHSCTCNAFISHKDWEWILLLIIIIFKWSALKASKGTPIIFCAWLSILHEQTPCFDIANGWLELTTPRKLNHSEENNQVRMAVSVP